MGISIFDFEFSILDFGNGKGYGILKVYYKEFMELVFRFMTKGETGLAYLDKVLSSSSRFPKGGAYGTEDKEEIVKVITRDIERVAKKNYYSFSPYPLSEAFAIYMIAQKPHGKPSEEDLLLPNRLYEEYEEKRLSDGSIRLYTEEGTLCIEEAEEGYFTLNSGFSPLFFLEALVKEALKNSEEMSVETLVKLVIELVMLPLVETYSSREELNRASESTVQKSAMLIVSTIGSSRQSIKEAKQDASEGRLRYLHWGTRDDNKYFNPIPLLETKRQAFAVDHYRLFMPGIMNKHRNTFRTLESYYKDNELYLTLCRFAVASEYPEGGKDSEMEFLSAKSISITSDIGSSFSNEEALGGTYRTILTSDNLKNDVLSEKPLGDLQSAFRLSDLFKGPDYYRMTVLEWVDICTD